MKSPSLPPLEALLVLDTDAIQAQYPNPSQDPHRPTPLGNVGWYLCTANPKKGKAARIKAWSISTYGNSDSATILYALRRSGAILKPHDRKPILFQIPHAVQPDPQQLDGLPPIPAVQYYVRNEASLGKGHIALLCASFAIYTLSANGEDQELWGYVSALFRVNQ
jgi:nematocidal protein AidA